ncbi:cell division protein ZapA (FtsZ GTPase activity inhibitor) [Elusimicrobium simillimum]|uniref:cell division protein ZapA n=1 Tax=Elusimicrobium simillimum TaxID=3143438 RepID=UPI003C6F89AA
MAKKGIEVSVRRIPLEVAITGVEPMEIATLVTMVEDRMQRISDNTGSVDTLKLAIMAAMEFAAEVYLKGSDDGAKRQEEQHRIDEIILKLQSTLSHTLPTK